MRRPKQHESVKTIRIRRAGCVGASQVELVETERRDRKLDVPMTRRRADRFYVDEGITTWHEPNDRSGQ